MASACTPSPSLTTSVSSPMTCSAESVSVRSVASDFCALDQLRYAPAQTSSNTDAMIAFRFQIFITNSSYCPFIFTTAILLLPSPVRLETAWMMASRTLALSAPSQTTSAP